MNQRPHGPETDEDGSDVSLAVSISACSSPFPSNVSRSVPGFSPCFGSNGTVMAQCRSPHIGSQMGFQTVSQAEAGTSDNIASPSRRFRLLRDRNLPNSAPNSPDVIRTEVPSNDEVRGIHYAPPSPVPLCGTGQIRACSYERPQLGPASLQHSVSRQLTPFKSARGRSPYIASCRCTSIGGVM